MISQLVPNCFNGFALVTVCPTDRHCAQFYVMQLLQNLLLTSAQSVISTSSFVSDENRTENNYVHENTIVKVSRSDI